jgi:D-alanyl-D-alanine carboxypeptidase/D-alanyl-D-alanine-endopeptidase (penicillin-binding protein 4)
MLRPFGAMVRIAVCLLPLSALPSTFADSVFAQPPRTAAERVFTGGPSPLLLRELIDYRDRAELGGTLAISVYSVKHQRFEAQSNDEQSLVPASILKLIVTAAALDAIPDDAAPRTTLEVAGTLRGRTLRGELRIIGGGDPNISDRFYPNAVTPLLAWADSLKARGIDTVRGRVTASDAYFTGPHRPDAWAARHFDTWYGAEVSALSFNDNAFEITVRPGDRAGMPPLVSVSPDVGYVKVVNRAKTVNAGGNRIAATLRPGETTVILTGRAGKNAGAKTWLLPVRNPPEYFRAGFLTALKARGIVVIEGGGTDRTGGKAAAPVQLTPLLRRRTREAMVSWFWMQLQRSTIL